MSARTLFQLKTPILAVRENAAAHEDRLVRIPAGAIVEPQQAHGDMVHVGWNEHRYSIFQVDLDEKCVRVSAA